MPRLGWVLTVALVTGAPAIAAEQSQDSCVPALPEQARQIIEARHSEWRILVASDLNKDDQEIWNRTHKGECPGIASGRFISPSRADYAVLLISKQSAHRRAQLIVITSSTFETATVYSSNEKITNYPVIYSGKPGKYHDFYDRKKFVQIDSDVLVYKYLESRSLTFYYKGSKFARLLTSD